jgi:hypothetical protein
VTTTLPITSIPIKLMNVSLEHPLPVEECVQKWTAEAEDFARRDPTKAVAIAFGVGLALNVMPKRLIVGTATLAAVTLLRPVLLSLGVLKAFEMCCPCKPQSSHPNPDPPIL